jgi:hypothetical protein
MASRSHIIAEVAGVVLDRRHRTDEQMLAEVQRRFGQGDPAEAAQAEFMLAALIFMAEEMGKDAVVMVRDRHSLAAYR